MPNISVDEIVVDGQTYVQKDSLEPIKGDIKIVILQRGWVMVGRFERNGSECRMSQASVIRSWGTTKGLGELAFCR